MDPIQWLATLAVAITSIGVIWRKAVRPVVHGINKLVDVIGPDEHGKTLPERMATVEERTAQLVPNGGKSLYDRVTKLELGQRSTNKRITAVTKGLAPMAEAIGTLAQRRNTPPTKEQS